MNENNSVWKLLSDLSQKKGISEVTINNVDTVFVERGGVFTQLKTQLTTKDLDEFISDIASFNGKICNMDHPLMDGNLPDGSRINIVLPPFANGSPAISIRKYLKGYSSFDTSPNVFELDAFWVDFMKAIVSARMNIVVSGGTGVGKTTFLNLLLREMGRAERVITIEDTIELDIINPNTVRLESSGKSSLDGAEVSTRDLVKNTLRMRPDRIIIGEVRGEELFDLLQAMNTGHEGSMTSIHSNSPGECFSRMETLFLMAGHNVPNIVIRKQISQALNFIIQLSRNREGKRIVKSIQEITGMEGDQIVSHTIAEYENGKLRSKGIAPMNMERIHLDGGLPMNYFDTKLKAVS